MSEAGERSTGAVIERWLRARPQEPVTANEVATAVGCVRRTAHKHLSRLADDGVVETKKVGARARVWWLGAPSATAADRSTDAFFAVDRGWEFTHLNDQAEQLLEESSEDLVGESMWEAFPGAVGSRFEAEYRRAVETQETVTFEEPYPPLDATFAVEACPSETGLFVYFRDVTERVRRERELRDRVHQQHVVASLGQRALATHDVEEFMQHTCEVVSETLDTDYCKVLEMQPADDTLGLCAGVGWDDGIVGNAEVPADTNSQAGYTLERREPVCVEELSTETRFSGPDLLTNHDVESGVSVVIGSPDEPWGILGTHDRSVREFSTHDADFVQSVATLLASAVDRHERERELQRYEQVFETLSDGVYAVDPEGRFTLVNEAYVQMTGRSRSELVGAHVSQLVGDGARERAKDLESELVDGTRSQATLEAELTRGSGERFPAEATFSLLQTSEGYERIGVVRDITARKRREEILERQHDRVARLNRLVLRIFAAIRGAIRAQSHEDISRTVCDRLVDGEVYEEAAIGSQHWHAESVTTGSGAAWTDTGWRERVPRLVERAVDTPGGVVVEDGTAALSLTYDDRTFGVLVLWTERTGPFDDDERTLLSELRTAIGLAMSAVERKNVLVNDSVATLEFASAALAEPFGDVGGDDAVEIVVDRVVPIDDRYVTHYSVSGLSAASFVDVIQQFDAVEEAHVANPESADSRVSATTTDAALVCQFRRFDGRVRSIVVEDGVLSVDVDVPVASVREAVDTINEAYPDLDLRAQRTTNRQAWTPTEFRSVVEDRLTERQQTALELAYFGGYFAWPRTTDGEELSATMGITPPTFHKHRRLAERRVLEALYEADRG